MQIVSMPQAKTHLSRLVDGLQKGTEREIVNTRNGKPVAKLVPLHGCDVGQRLGIAKDAFTAPKDIERLNPEVTVCFQGKK